jgi:flagellar biosynthetic protein FliQ
LARWRAASTNENTPLAGRVASDHRAARDWQCPHGKAAMTPETVMSMTYQAMKLALVMAGPLLLVTLVVGLLISIFQAATQINEMTLSFIPKLLATGAALAMLGPWLIEAMVDYLHMLFSGIPGLVS